ncbi:MAG: hypothetical protein EBU86_04175, partial [Actinobacteria bacterium]|nr:hypothetical protein [Actinomycetota bacterium]
QLQKRVMPTSFYALDVEIRRVVSVVASFKSTWIERSHNAICVKKILQIGDAYIAQIIVPM